MDKSYEELRERIESLERKVEQLQNISPSSIEEYLHRSREKVTGLRTLAVANGRMHQYIEKGNAFAYPCEDNEIAIVGSLLYIGHSIVINIKYPFSLNDMDIVLTDKSRIPIPLSNQRNAVKRMFNL